MIQVNIENIIHFNFPSEFNDATGLNYNELSDAEVFNALIQWWHPSEHETNWYDAKHVNTNFLGVSYKHGNEQFLLSRYDRGLAIGLSRMIETREVL
jgi:hypothetical protein